jgi:hypothetical protein
MLPAQQINENKVKRNGNKSGKPTAICFNFTARKIAGQVIIYIFMYQQSHVKQQYALQWTG